MFNLAKQRKKLPKELEPFVAYHKSLKDQGAQTFNIELQKLVLQILNPTDEKNPGARDVLIDRAKKEPYWNYVWHFDPEYRDELIKAADNAAGHFRMHPKEFKQFLDQIAPPGSKPPQPQQGGMGGGLGGPGGGAPPPGGGGAPMPMASSDREEKYGQRMYLCRDDGRYTLKGTIVSNLIKGKQQYINGDGINCVLVVDKRDLAVPRSGSSGKEGIRLQEEMPHAVFSALKDILRSKGVREAVPMARSITARAWKTGAWDFTPASVNFGGLLLGFLIREHAGREPDEISELRRAAGQAMMPHINGLISALADEGISAKERPLPMPVYTEAGRLEKENRQKGPDQISTHANPTVLNAEDASESFDIQSLFMTISGKSDQGTKQRAIGRLTEIICKNPEVYQAHRLSEQELLSILKKAPNCDAEELVKFSKLVDADDADLMEAFAFGDFRQKKLVSDLVASQWREDLIRATPDMALLFDPDRNMANLNHPLFAALDCSDHAALQIVVKALRLSRQGSLRCSENLLSKKAMEAIIKTNDREALTVALDSKQPVRYFAIAYLLEKGEDPALAMAAIDFQDDSPNAYPYQVLACVALAKHSDDLDALRAARRAMDVRPDDIAFVGGREVAAKYMRANRLAWDGTSVPEATDFYSLPDDPLRLAKNLILLEDVAGMISLLHLCAKKLEKRPDARLRHAAEMLRDALGKGGKYQFSLEEDEGSEWKGTMLADGHVMASRDGIHLVSADGKLFCFAAEDAKAEETALALVLSKGKQA